RGGAFRKSLDAKARAASAAGHDEGLPAVRHAHSCRGEEVRALHQRGVRQISDTNLDGHRGLRGRGTDESAREGPAAGYRKRHTRGVGYGLKAAASRRTPKWPGAQWSEMLASSSAGASSGWIPGGHEGVSRPRPPALLPVLFALPRVRSGPHHGGGIPAARWTR